MDAPASAASIEKQVGRLLQRAEALRRFPTPVDDIVAAQQLVVTDPATSPLAPGMIARAPAALRTRLTAVGFKVLAVLDRREREVHLAPESLEVQRRFRKLHEVGHDVCGWQDFGHHLDGTEQLSPQVEELFEREANYAAAGLLFQGRIFSELADSFETGMAAVLHLAQTFGSSIHAAFRQYVQTNLHPVAGFILQRSPTLHPATETLSFGTKLTFASVKFRAMFSLCDGDVGTLTTEALPGLDHAWRQLSATGGIGCGEYSLGRRDGGTSPARLELFSNSYNLFLLVVPQERRWLAKHVKLSA